MQRILDRVELSWVNIVSVDGGATKTIAVVYNEEKKLLGAGVSGPSNYRNVGVRMFKINLLSAIEKAVTSSGASDIGEYTFALAGMKDSKKSSDKIMGILNAIIPSSSISFFNDGEAGFFSRFPEGRGIVVAPGTGMVSYGRTGEKIERSSGWGWFLDDEGSAFFIGKRALQEAVKLMDKRDERVSILPDFVRQYYGLSADRDIINIIHRKVFDVRGIALLSRYVSKFAMEGDPVSLGIMKEAAEETSRAAVSLYKRLGEPKDITISGYGGVLRAGEWYWDMIKNNIENKIGKSQFRPPISGYEAVLGSIVLKYKILGVNVDEAMITDFRKQLSVLIDRMSAEDKKEFLLL